MTPTTMIDLRSDTVTRPTPEMRRAVAEARVGDDVYGDDPTINELEERVARLAGKEAAVFVPSGTMGNQLAIHCLTTPGDEIVLEARSHIYLNEQGGLAALSGCLAHPVPSDRGAIAPATLEAAIRDEDDHVARLTLVCLENTHNAHGGAIVPLERLRGVAALAHERGIRVHLDGARLWNASVATGVPIHEWAAVADTAMMCFSKGLGCPVGSVLVGTAELVRRARRQRKLWGGSMRQVGVLGAACLHALDHHVDRLADDHRRAQALGDGLHGTRGIRIQDVETNIVMIDLEHPALEPAATVQALHERGVMVGAVGPRRLRAMTHLDVDDPGIARAVQAFQEVVKQRVGRRARAASA